MELEERLSVCERLRWTCSTHAGNGLCGCGGCGGMSSSVPFGVDLHCL